MKAFQDLAPSNRNILSTFFCYWGYLATILDQLISSNNSSVHTSFHHFQINLWVCVQMVWYVQSKYLSSEWTDPAPGKINQSIKQTSRLSGYPLEMTQVGMHGEKRELKKKHYYGCISTHVKDVQYTSMRTKGSETETYSSYIIIEKEVRAQPKQDGIISSLLTAENGCLHQKAQSDVTAELCRLGMTIISYSVQDVIRTYFYLKNKQRGRNEIF